MDIDFWYIIFLSQKRHSNANKSKLLKSNIK